MNLTKDFTDSLLIITGISLAIALLHIGIIYFNTIDYSTSYTIFYYISSLAFWGMVAQITKDFRAPLIALAIIIIPSIIVEFINVENILLRVFLFNIFPFIAYVTYGFLTFGNTFASYTMGLFGLAIVGIYRYVSMESGFEDIFRELDWLRMEFVIEDDRTSSLYLASFFVMKLGLIMNFILFWYVYSYLKVNNNKFDFSFKRTQLFGNMNPITFSIIFWVFRIFIMSSVVSVGNVAFRFRDNFFVTDIFFITISLIGVYLLFSVYRNFLSSYFVQRKRYTSWFYLLLNIPIINIFAWLILLVSRDEPIDQYRRGVNVEDYSDKSNSRIKNDAFFLQRLFHVENRNAGIKVLIVILVILSLLITLVAQMSMGMANPIIIVGSLLSFIFLMWMFNAENAVYYIFGLYCIIFLVFPFVGLDSRQFQYSSLTLFGVGQLMYILPLFHFDCLQFYDNNENDLDSELDEVLEHLI